MIDPELEHCYMSINQLIATLTEYSAEFGNCPVYIRIKDFGAMALLVTAGIGVHEKYKQFGPVGILSNEELHAGKFYE